MKWDYCCCAIPVLNVGAYVTLCEQFVLGVLVGTLSFATPTLVGSSIPFSGSNLILCGLGYAFAIVQLVGFIGVFKEKAALFRRYVAINWIVLYAAFAVAAALIGISAARHSQAVNACESSFFTEDTSSTQEDTKGEQICNIFCWITVGVMGALWVLLFLVQSYFILVLRNYGVSQRADHTKYHSIYSAHDGGDNIMLNNVRSGTNGIEDEWNTRPSTDSWHPRGQNAYRDDEPGSYNPPPVHGHETYNIPADAQKTLPPEDKNMGYGVGVGANTPSKQASVDDVYLEHPSKGGVKSPVMTGTKIYDENPPSYHGHGSEEQATTAGKAPENKLPPWQQQQPYNPYQSSGSRI